jgi:hypothetical protein
MDSASWATPLHAEIERLGGTVSLDRKSIRYRDQDISRRDCESCVDVQAAHQHRGVRGFPLATRLLSPADKITIAEEMAARRNVKLVTGISEA